jgi:hypothetical protein
MNADDTMPIDANVTIRKKTTIPSKQKTTLKLILWTLTRVMDLETANAKAIEMFKLGESIETIIEAVDNIEKSAEYAEMDTNLASLCVKPAKKSRAKKDATAISGDADTIIKEMVEMATAEVKATPVKKSRVKKVAGETNVLVPVLDEETKTKPRTKAKAKVENVSPEALTEVNVEKTETVKKPRAKANAKAKTNESVENVSTEASTEVSSDVKVDEPATKHATKSRAKAKAKEDDNVEKEEPVKKSKPKAKAKASTEDDNVEGEEPVKKPQAKAKAKEDDNVEGEEPVKKHQAKAATKPATKAATKPEPPEETPITNDLAEEEYLVLNEVEYKGKQYMVGGDQNVYDEFNAVIGKYENGIITLNA